MKIQVVLSPDAKEDIRVTIEWYHRADPDLASRFEKQTLTTLRHIGQFPYRFGIISGSVRRARLKRFPYAVYYACIYDEALVSAVLHERRSDDVWRQRSKMLT